MSFHDVLMDDQVVGQVEMTVQGLYYSICCRCRSIKGVLKLMDRCDMGEVPIGICCPVGRGLEIDRKIAIKKLGIGDHFFYLVAHGADNPEFYQLDPNQPCAVMDRLEQARFVIRDGVAGLVFTAQSETHP